jgi:DNA-binding transcriptional LysR family regulator
MREAKTPTTDIRTPSANSRRASSPRGAPTGLKDTDGRSIKPTQMRHFLGLAEELHFGRAADRLGIAQPPLSQSILRLEANLGVRLINRQRNAISLTPAGHAFAREARLALRQLALAEHAARRAAHGEVDELRVGFVGPALFSLVPTMLIRYREIPGAVKLKLFEETSRAQIPALKRGALDLGIFMPPPEPIEGIEVKVVESSRIVACVPKYSALANRDEVSLVDLAEHPFIMYPLGVEPGIAEIILNTCREIGVKPRLEQQTLRAMTMLSMVACGLGVAFVAETARLSGFNSVAFVPIAELPNLRRPLAVGWRDEDAPTALREMVDLLLSINFGSGGASARPA